MPKASKVVSIASGQVKANPFQIMLIVGPTRYVVDLRTRQNKKIGPADVLEFPPSASIQLANPDERSDRCGDRQGWSEGEGIPMPVFSIDREDRIRVIDKTAAKDNREGSLSFRSEKELEELAKRWTIARLVGVWNRISGAPPVRKFASRQIATARIWRAIQNLAPVPSKQRVTRQEAPVAKLTSPAERGQGSKKDEVIALLSAGAGVTLPQLMAATGWQKHSVRGFLSTLKKKMGLTIQSSQNAAGERVYGVADSVR